VPFIFETHMAMMMMLLTFCVD